MPLCIEMHGQHALEHGSIGVGLNLVVSIVGVLAWSWRQTPLAGKSLDGRDGGMAVCGGVCLQLSVTSVVTKKSLEISPSADILFQTETS